MKFLSVLLVLILSLLCIPATAEIGYPPYDYLVNKGYFLERMDDSPGWRTCNLMGGDGWWGLSFSDETDRWTLMALPIFNPTFDLSEFEKLFVEMVEKFDWDISFYWPDYDSGSNMAISYNIVRDIDRTDENYMDKAGYLNALRNQFGMLSAEAFEETVPSAENSRRNPASVGQVVNIDASCRGLDYTMSVVVDEFYRGNDYMRLVNGNPKTASNGYEYVAVKVTVTFESINSIQPDVLGTDDPEIMVDSIFNFASYSETGSKYDNVHYSVSGQKDLSHVFEGASTTGYFQFEVSKEDPAPMLVYEPERDQRVFISLK